MSLKNTISATEVRKNFFKIIEQVSKSNISYIITKNGQADAVILGADEYDRIVKIIKPQSNEFILREPLTKYKVSKITRVYLDTSVPNYLFATDRPDRQNITKKFFKVLKKKRIKTITSSVTQREIAKTGDSKRRLQLSKIIEQFQIKTVVSEEESRLAQLYLQARAVPQRYIDDALHLAIATNERVDALVSWNFKHMVNLNVKKLINKINIENGYQVLEIITPEEFMGDENENIT